MSSRYGLALDRLGIQSGCGPDFEKPCNVLFVFFLQFETLDFTIIFKRITQNPSNILLHEQRLT